MTWYGSCEGNVRRATLDHHLEAAEILDKQPEMARLFEMNIESTAVEELTEIRGRGSALFYESPSWVLHANRDIGNRAPSRDGVCITSSALLWLQVLNCCLLLWTSKPQSNIFYLQRCSNFTKLGERGTKRGIWRIMNWRISNLSRHQGRTFLKTDWCLRRISGVSHISIFRSSTSPYLVAEMDSLHEERRKDSVQYQQIIEQRSLFIATVNLSLWFPLHYGLSISITSRSPLTFTAPWRISELRPIVGTGL